MERISNPTQLEIYDSDLHRCKVSGALLPPPDGRTDLEKQLAQALFIAKTFIIQSQHTEKLTWSVIQVVDCIDNALAVARPEQLR